MDNIHILLIVIAVGAIVGSIPVRGFSLESLGVLLSGMVFGALGYRIDPVFMGFGVALFIYGIALQIGPGFVEGFKRNAFRLGLVALAVSFTGALVTFLASWIFRLPPVTTQGIFAGTFNNAIALASTGVDDNPELFLSFGLVYPVAFSLVLLFVVLIPRFLGANLKKEAQAYFEEQDRLHPRPETRRYEIRNPGCFDKKLAELNLPGLVGSVITRIVRDNKELLLDANLSLKEGDLVEAVGETGSLDQLEVVLGTSFSGQLPRNRKGKIVERRFLLTNKAIVGKNLSQLGLQSRFHATVTRIRRGGVDLPVRRHTQLAYGDRISLVVPHESGQELTALFGNDLHAFGQQELYPVLLGMALGALLGLVSFGGFRLGLSGGVLIVGMVAGRLGRIGPVVFTITAQANHILKRLGLILFMAALGTSSGEVLLPNLGLATLGHVLISVLSIVLSLTVAMLIARFVLRRNLVEVMAICAGAVACTPALETANARAGRNDSAVIYAAIYPMGLMAPVFLMQLIIRLQQTFL